MKWQFRYIMARLEVLQIAQAAPAICGRVGRPLIMIKMTNSHPIHRNILC